MEVTLVRIVQHQCLFYPYRFDSAPLSLCGKLSIL